MNGELEESRGALSFEVVALQVQIASPRRFHRRLLTSTEFRCAATGRSSGGAEPGPVEAVVPGFQGHPPQIHSGNY